MLFIKRFSDFVTVAALTPLSSSLCIDSAEQEGSTVTAQPRFCSSRMMLRFAP